MHPIMVRILKTVKRLLITLLIIVGTLFLIGTGLFLIYKNSIQQTILQEINKQLTAEVQAGKIKVSMRSHFPMISMDIKDIKITDPLDRANGIDVFQADELSLRFNVIDILHKKYTLEAVKLNNARIHLMVFDDGSDNFHFWQLPSPTEPTAFSMEIRQVILHLVDVSWQNRITNDYYAIRAIDSKAKGHFTNHDHELLVKGNFFTHLIKQADVTYVQNREWQANVRLHVNNRDQTYKIMDGMIRTGLLTFYLNGSIKAKQEVETDLTFFTEEAPLSEYLSLVPSHYLSFLKNVVIRGNVSTKVTIKGSIDEKTVPDLRMTFRLDKGSLNLQNAGVQLDRILAEGCYSFLSCDRNKVKDELRIDRIRASLGDGWLEGSVRLSDLSQPYVSLTADMNLPLQELWNFIPMDTLRDIAGQLNMKVTLQGPLQGLNEVDAPDLLNWSIQGEANLIIDRMLLKGSSLKYHDIQGSFRIDNQHLTIQNLSGKIETSDFNLQGVIPNCLPRVFSKDEILRIDLALTSNRLNISEFLKNSHDLTGEGYHLDLPTKITMNLDVSLQEFLFNDFLATRVKTKLILRDQRIVLNDLSLTSMEGNITADVDLTPVNDHLYDLKCNARMEHVNIRQLFHDFGNFNQASLTDEHLRGYVDADLFYVSRLSSDLKIDLKSIYTLGQVKITSGELIGYTPLYQLADFLNIEDLKHIRFSALNNLIEIRHQTIVIPEMEIKSNTLDLTLSGTHTFNNDIDYHLSLLLSQLLSKKIKPDPQQEFGVIKDDGLGRSKLFIAMKGTADHPKFSYDRPAFKEKLSQDLQKERQDIKEALLDEFGIRRDPSSESERMTVQEQGNFIIDWEEDSQDSALQQQDRKKIQGPKFNIKWEVSDTMPVSMPAVLPLP